MVRFFLTSYFNLYLCHHLCIPTHIEMSALVQQLPDLSPLLSQAVGDIPFLSLAGGAGLGERSSEHQPGLCWRPCEEWANRPSPNPPAPPWDIDDRAVQKQTTPKVKLNQPVNVVLVLVPAAKEENRGSNCLALLLLPSPLLEEINIWQQNQGYFVMLAPEKA